MLNYNISWGNKLSHDEGVQYLCLSDSLVMPHSLLSVVQSFHAKAYDNDTKNFYIEDYYKVRGQT